MLPAFGVGGEAAPEWLATGRSTKGRGAQANEALELMTRLWSEERVTFHGKYYQYTDAAISPRPVQQPLPLWIGGASEAAIRRTARLGNGWLGGLHTPEQSARVVAAIKVAAAEAGRTIDDDHYGASFPSASRLGRARRTTDRRRLHASGRRLGATELLCRRRRRRHRRPRPRIPRGRRLQVRPPPHRRGRPGHLHADAALIEEVLPAVHGAQVTAG